jgi:hypothetical protein
MLEGRVEKVEAQRDLRNPKLQHVGETSVSCTTYRVEGYW